MANQLTRYATVASVRTADEGYFTPFGLGSTSNGVMMSVVDEMRLSQFVLSIQLRVRLIKVEVTTGGGASSLLGIGVYDKDGNLLLESGAQDANTIGAQSYTLSTPVLLEPGIYFLGWSSDSTSTATVRVDVSGNDLTDLLNTGTVKKAGLGANDSSAGILPATMGTITASGNIPPLIVFEP